MGIIPRSAPGCGFVLVLATFTRTDTRAVSKSEAAWWEEEVEDVELLIVLTCNLILVGRIGK